MKRYDLSFTEYVNLGEYESSCSMAETSDGEWLSRDEIIEALPKASCVDIASILHVLGITQEEYHEALDNAMVRDLQEYSDLMKELNQ